MAWSGDRHGTRYAAICNVAGHLRHTTTNVDLRLVELGPGGVRFSDLQPAADQAVRVYMHKRDPRDYQRYEWSYDFADYAEGSKPLVVFRGSVLTIHFNADIALRSDNLDSGRVLFSLPAGTVTGTVTDKQHRLLRSSPPMKTFRLLGLLALFAIPALAQEPRDDPRAGVLVDCGGEKVAIFEHTESKDGHYALGWTIRPHRKQDPVDWSAYHRENPWDMVEKYSGTTDDEPAKADYLVVDGVLDLRGKTFTPLPSNAPFYPNRGHAGIAVAWESDVRRDGPTALVAIEARFSTNDLFLVRLDVGAPQVTALSPAADKAVSDGMKKRDPKDYREYETTYQLEPGGDPASSPVRFQPDALTVRFDTAEPKSAVNVDAGSITFALPKGSVRRVVFDKK